MDIAPSGQILGARITGIDLGQSLADTDRRAILRALGEYGVLCFPRQTLDTDQLSAFGSRFGELEINVANAYHEPNHPEMMILSNMRPNGKQIGANDAGQAGTPTCRTVATSHLPTSCTLGTCRCATASRSARRSFATCTPPTKTCPTR